MTSMVRHSLHTLPPPTQPTTDTPAIDMLDEFSATKLDTPAPAAPSAPTTSGPGRPSTQPTAAGATASSTAEEDEFAAQLQAGMAEMLRELEANPELAAQFEAMMGGALPGMPGAPAPASSSAPSAAKIPSVKPASASASATTAPLNSATDDFQSTIRRTMERMQSSSASADRAGPSPLNNGGAGSEDDVLAALLAQMGAAGSEGEAGGDDAFSKMLLGMMEQLTNREILYEPMKELQTKFPAWLAERAPGAAKAGEVDEGEMARFREQARLVGEIVARFERRGYSDGNAADREFIVERMQQVSSFGVKGLAVCVHACVLMSGGVDAGCWGAAAGAGGGYGLGAGDDGRSRRWVPAAVMSVEVLVGGESKTARWGMCCRYCACTASYS